jgi:peptidoglycan/xylan/chitin deacetylase (PgdA/CDA1 family)
MLINGESRKEVVRPDRLAILIYHGVKAILLKAFISNTQNYPFLWKAFIRKTYALPILMYHRIAPTGAPTTASLRVTPEAFEDHLRYLKKAGFYSLRLEDWQSAMAARRFLPGRAIAITFDDGYQDFYEYAHPLLKKYGFTATVFLVADLIGRANLWDEAYGEVIPLMGWQEIRQLRDEGIIFGSHSMSHRLLTSLSFKEILQEGERSRTLLERGLGVPVTAFAYPYGDFNAEVEHLIGACGYMVGLSCRLGLSRFQDRLLALPRIVVMGSDVEELVGQLSKAVILNWMDFFRGPRQDISVWLGQG